MKETDAKQKRCWRDLSQQCHGSDCMAWRLLAPIYDEVVDLEREIETMTLREADQHIQERSQELLALGYAVIAYPLAGAPNLYGRGSHDAGHCSFVGPGQ
jgi:hypothetical protein